ncbi:MAG TPA: hypothetical protein VMU04_05475 [Candidatus Acidoferrum sp.]|nr:hypothetical protein [Candidatus Acidoferrum sp.]
MEITLNRLFKRITVNGPLRGSDRRPVHPPAVLKDANRLPNGTFQFKAQLAKGTPFVVQSSADLETWSPVLNGIASGEVANYTDTHASRFNYRFYRLVSGKAAPSNIIGYIAITLPPGFSMIGNPLDGPTNTLGKVFKDWPDGTTFNKFDTRQFKLVESALHFCQWSNPSEQLLPGEGAIVFNPTSDYRSACFTGQIVPGSLSVVIPPGFSMCSSPLPQSGSLAEDLEFPIADGDVIHLFDRDKQQYVLYPYENGHWATGAPLLSVGEAFWVARKETGTWKRTLEQADGPPPGSAN